MRGEFEAKDQRMQWYLSQVKQPQSSFKAFSIKQVPKSKNAYADSLATFDTSLGEGLPRVIIVEGLAAMSWDGQVPIGINKIHVGLSWMDLVVSSLKDETLIEDKSEAEKNPKKGTTVLALGRVEIIQTIIF